MLSGRLSMNELRMRPRLSILFHTKTAVWFARHRIELVRRAAVLVKGAHARRALKRADTCARSNAAWKHVGCLHKNAGLRSSCMFQLRDAEDVAAAKECAARMSGVPRVRRLQFISSQPKKMIGCGRGSHTSSIVSRVRVQPVILAHVPHLRCHTRSQEYRSLFVRKRALGNNLCVSCFVPRACGVS